MTIMLFVLACGAGTPSPPVPTPTPSPEVTVVETVEVETEVTVNEIIEVPEIHVDCIYWADVVVWLDQNADGIRGAGEAPLPGIRVQALVKDKYVVARARSNENGVAELLSDTFVGCDDQFWVSVDDAPPGYRLTTAPRVLSSGGEAEDIQFGFVRDDSTATQTPSP
jgi:hypothetical protein